MDMECDGQEVDTEDEYESEELHAFNCFLAGLSDLGYGFSYWVPDAQYFGLAQRRERVFVVGYLGDWRPAAAVFLERESLQGHPAPRREKGKGLAGTIEASLGRRCEQPNDYDPAGGLKRMDFESETLVAFQTRGSNVGVGDISGTIGSNADRASGSAPCIASVAFALGSHAGAANGGQTNRSHAMGGPVGSGISEELSYSLRSGRNQNIGGNTGVRRLTPLECERLQGFPPNYTRIPWRGKPAQDCPDGPRYKAIGNSMAVPVMAWIGRRIAMVEEVLKGLPPH
jgi:DNA (cytosine-5)-methyltransferase 1